MKRVFLKSMVVLAAASLLQSMPAGAQVSPTTERAARVRITKGPEIERVDPDFAIICWTSNNPGGSPEHYGIVHYGMDPKKLDQTAKSPIRLNPTRGYTVFRVRMDGLKPATTYYYKVESTEANGDSDEMESSIRHFTKPP